MTFKLYWEDDPEFFKKIIWDIGFRDWCSVSVDQRKVALQHLINSWWLDEFSDEALYAISTLNHNFLAILPGKRLHKIIPVHDIHRWNEYERKKAAYQDFCEIFTTTSSDPIFLRMISEFASKFLNSVFDLERFDRLANCLNHIFDQFSVNIHMTKNGLIPRQDDRIINEIYNPTLAVLSDQKWQNVNTHLREMFNDFHAKKYSECITKAHSAVQRFLQILVWQEEGKNWEGEIGKLFSEIKNRKIIPIDRFNEPIIDVFKSFIPSQRATKSTAKPSKQEALPSDALLMMNVVMVLIQHCLQSPSE